jgi:hypothetical protein
LDCRIERLSFGGLAKHQKGQDDERRQKSGDDDQPDPAPARSARRERRRLVFGFGGRRAAPVADERLVGDFGSTLTTEHTDL